MLRRIPIMRHTNYHTNVPSAEDVYETPNKSLETLVKQ